MTERPWFKWYPSDWRGESTLRMCSLAARGLWIELLGLMHESSTPGHLLFNGRVPSLPQLAAVVGADHKQVSKLLEELDQAGVFSRSDEGAIVSRRMVRDHEKATGRPSSELSGQAAAGYQGASSRWRRDRSGVGATRSQRMTEARQKGRHTPEEWERMIAFCDQRCVRCGKPEPLVRDHITPIYKGGSDSIDNLQPLCVSCNSSKGPEDADFRKNGWQEVVKTPGIVCEMPGKMPDENASTYAGAAPRARSRPRSQIPEREEAAARAPARETGSPMPRRGDPPERWHHLTTKREVDADGQTHAIAGGYYVDQAAELVCKAAGIHDVTWRGDWGTLLRWLDDGFDLTETILPVIRQVASRFNYRPPNTLMYFDKTLRASGFAGSKGVGVSANNTGAKSLPGLNL